MLHHTDLIMYYKIIFSMVQHHKYSIEDLENLIPYERDIYYDMLLDYIAKLEEQKGK